MKRLHKGGESEENAFLSEIKPSIFFLIKLGAKHNDVSLLGHQKKMHSCIFSLSVWSNLSILVDSLIFLPSCLSHFHLIQDHPHVSISMGLKELP